MMNPSDEEQIQITIEQAKEMVALGEAIQRLQRNADFQLVIDKGYFEKEAIRLVLLKSNPHPQIQAAEMQIQIDNDIRSIGTLFQYLNLCLHNAHMATGSIEANEAELEYMRNEEFDGE